MTVPGIGPIISSAVVAVIGTGSGFKQGSSESAPRVVDVKLRDGLAFDLIYRLHDLAISGVVVSVFDFPDTGWKVAAILQ